MLEEGERLAVIRTKPMSLKEKARLELLTPDDFPPPHLDTRGWNFNREEANER